MWKMDVGNLIKNKASLLKNFHLPPSELDKMPMWEYELMMKELNGMIEEENKMQEDQMRESGMDPRNPGRSIRGFTKPMKSFQESKMPSFNMSMPSSFGAPIKF